MRRPQTRLIFTFYRKAKSLQLVWFDSPLLRPFDGANIHYAIEKMSGISFQQPNYYTLRYA